MPGVDNGSASTADVRPGSGLKIIEALAQAPRCEFQFNLGEDGSKSVLMIPIEQDRLRRAQVCTSRRDTWFTFADRLLIVEGRREALGEAAPGASCRDKDSVTLRSEGFCHAGFCP